MQDFIPVLHANSIRTEYHEAYDGTWSELAAVGGSRSQRQTMLRSELGSGIFDGFNGMAACFQIWVKITDDPYIKLYLYLSGLN